MKKSALKLMGSGFGKKILKKVVMTSLSIQLPIGGDFEDPGRQNLFGTSFDQDGFHPVVQLHEPLRLVHDEKGCLGNIHLGSIQKK
jgi:hypothetical protein